jgi:ABC-type branched-subunit amino acid transport system permease subunit
MAGIVLLVRRARIGTLLRALSDSPTGLETHGANTTIMRVQVFALSAFMAGVGGAVIAGATQNASGAPGGTFDYTVSLIFVAVLGFCGRRPILSPVVAAVVYQVLKIYSPFDKHWAIEYRGVAFGGLAILVAIWPALNLGERLKRHGISLPSRTGRQGSHRAAGEQTPAEAGDIDSWDPDAAPPNVATEAMDNTHA